MAARPAAAGRTTKRGYVPFFARSAAARHVLVEEAWNLNSILSCAPDHLAFSPSRFLTATTLPRRSTPQARYIYLHSSSIRHILLNISETLTVDNRPSNPRYPCAIHSTTNDNEATAAPHRASRAALMIRQEAATAAPHWARSHRRAAGTSAARAGQDSEATAAPHRATVAPET